MGNPNPQMNLDANESAFFMREIEFIKAVTYDIKYRALKALELFPISTEANTGATEITWRQFRGFGKAKIGGEYGNEYPKADVAGAEFTYKIVPVQMGYQYSIQEIRESQMSGKRLDQRRAAFARRAVDQAINDVALIGDAGTNISGFLSYPGISSITLPATGAGSSKTWASKTPDQIIYDITTLIEGVWVTTNGVEYPDTLLIPTADFAQIATTRITAVDSETILSFLLRTSPWIKTVDWLVELAGAGVSGSNRSMVFVRDDMHLSLEIPQPFEQFDPQQNGFVFDIPCHARTAGLLVYYPLSVGYGDGV